MVFDAACRTKDLWLSSAPQVSCAAPVRLQAGDDARLPVHVRVQPVDSGCCVQPVDKRGNRQVAYPASGPPPVERLVTLLLARGWPGLRRVERTHRVRVSPAEALFDTPASARLRSAGRCAALPRADPIA